MGKNTHSATSNPNVVAAAADVRQEHLRTQVDDLNDFISVLESQQTHIQKSLDTLTTSNTTFQNTMTSQFAGFQSLMLEELHLLKSGLLHSQTTHLTPTSSLSPLQPQNQTTASLGPRTSNLNTSPSLCSLFVSSNALPSCLSLSLPPTLTEPSPTSHLHHYHSTHPDSHHNNQPNQP
ncbi:hypothetical protein ACFX2J_035658 [Malus domestica]